MLHELLSELAARRGWTFRSAVFQARELARVSRVSFRTAALNLLKR